MAWLAVAGWVAIAALVPGRIKKKQCSNKMVS
jgi:hypothetical protein